MNGELKQRLSTCFPPWFSVERVIEEGNIHTHAHYGCRAT